MNCANHADQSAAHYCRTCGKALCASCERPVRGVIYCEECLGARMEGTAAGFVPPPVPPAGAVPPAFMAPPVPPPPGVPGQATSGPNPTVAGILAGVFPFGVGAVYTGQYAKGLAHLAIFGLLIAGCNVNGSDVIPAICGIGIAFFIVYQIFDAVRSARNIQAGLPPPDPYGLAASFGAGAPGGGAKSDAARVPMGAIVLILLGAIFLLHTAGLFEFGFDRFWPVLLMFLGAWLFVRNYGLMGDPGPMDARTRSRRLMGPAVLFTIGTLFLLEKVGAASFHRTWPIILLVIGGVKLVQRAEPAALAGGIPPQAPPMSPPPGPPSAPASEVKSGEVHNG